MELITKKREKLIKSLFPSSISQIWCPPLTHYKQDGEIDFFRMKKHIDYLLPYINSFLIPGSTGDGWEISLNEYKQILSFVHKEFGEKNKINLIIGLLRFSPSERKEFLDYAINFLKDKKVAYKADNNEFSYFKGFVICAKKGKEFSEEEIKKDIETIITKNLPVVLYQLPQVTENELSPELVEKIVKKYYNVYMIKDSSGKDKIVNAQKNYQNLIILRGAEGNYFENLRKTGGKYYGFLLSTGNSFPKELKMLVELVNEGKNKEAKKLSDKLTETVNSVFEVAQQIPKGNAFTNSNKLIDHLNAYGEKWRNFPAPRLHSGKKIDDTLLEKTVKILTKFGFLKKKGYMLYYFN